MKPGRRSVASSALIALASALALAASPEVQAAERSPARADARAKPAAREARKRLRYNLESVELRGNTRTTAHVVLRYVKFRRGDLLDVEDPRIELTRYRLLGTGFFSKVELSLRRGSQRGSAVLVIDVEERNTLVVQQLGMGIAADEDTAGNAKPISAYLGVQVAETNLAGTGITLGAGLALAADQLALRTTFLDPTFAGSEWSASASLLYTNGLDFFGSRSVAFESPGLQQRAVTDYAVVAYKRFGGTLGVGHDLTAVSTFQLDYHLEQIDATVPTVASHMRGDHREPVDFSVLGGKSVLSSLRGRLAYDTRDAPFLTTRGTLATFAVTLGAAPLGSDYAYQKAELSLSRWFRLPWKHVVRLEAFTGAIAGSAPFFEQFYVGDFSDFLPDRMLELSPDRRRPPNFLNTDIVEVRYGDYAAKLSAEYRLDLYRGRGSIYGVDLFASGGVYGVATHEDLTDPPSGYRGARRVPIDLTTNLGLRIDTSVGGITLAFSNLFGFVPTRQGSRR